MKTRCLLLLWLALPGLFLHQPAFPVDYIPQSWESSEQESDFVGVIVCTVAGENVARYRVIEVWKGDVLAGRELLAFGHSDPYNLAPYISLVGSQSIAFLQLRGIEQAPREMSSLNNILPAPIKMRIMPADARFHAALPVDQRQKVIDFLALTPAEQELHRYRAEFQFLWGDKLKEELLPKALAASSVEEILQLVHDFKQSHPSSEHGGLNDAIMNAAGPITLRFAEENPTFVESHHLDRIRRLLDPPVPFVEARPYQVPAELTRGERDELRRTLANDSPPDDFTGTRNWARAFFILSERDPKFVANYLIDGKRARQRHEKAYFGYILGSLFAIHCTGNREAHLARLLEASDPLISVAGAVYLTFENEPRGLRALRERTGLSGDAGAWAALALARRGDKEALPRALELVGVPTITSHSSITPPEGNSLTRALRGGLLVLLSNSAQASGQPQPPRPTNSFEEDLAALREWWATHGDKITLHDPWLDRLASQKID